MAETEFKIDKDVPVLSWGRGHYPDYPWPKMAPGDSVLFPLDDGGSMKNHQARLSGNASVWGKQNGAKFVTRRIDLPNGELGVRVWRVE